MLSANQQSVVWFVGVSDYEVLFHALEAQRRASSGGERRAVRRLAENALQNARMGSLTQGLPELELRGDQALLVFRAMETLVEHVAGEVSPSPVACRTAGRALEMLAEYRGPRPQDGLYTRLFDSSNVS